MTTAIGVIDYGMGNRRSVEKALEHVGAHVGRSPATTTSCAPATASCCPASARSRRRCATSASSGLVELIQARVEQRTPLLGICLGMQLLFDGSEELGTTAGLGLIAGEVTRLEAGGLRIPHIGWNEVRFERPSPLLAGLPRAGAPSTTCTPTRRDPPTRTIVVGDAPSTASGSRRSVGRGSVFGVQFHPEKSSLNGLRMLDGFAAICAGAAGARA